MESMPTAFEPLLEKAQAYGKTSIELYKLKAVEKTAGLTSNIVANGTVFLAFFLCIAMAGIGLALWLGELFGKLYYGFLSVAGFYAVVGCILYFFLRDWIKTHTGNSIVKQMLN